MSDDYAKLSNADIGWVIAKKKGWSDIQPLGDVFVVYSPEGKLRAEHPRYSTDIAAAWELAEEMRAYVGPRGPDWYCKTGRDVNEAGVVYTWSDTAPRAICLAWLKWKEGTK